MGQDVSISRRHAQIRYQDGHFYIEDLESKFGTSVCMKEQQRTLNSVHSTSIQVGRTVMKFTLCVSATLNDQVTIVGSGRVGTVIVHDPADAELTYKVAFYNDEFGNKND